MHLKGNTTEYQVWDTLCLCLRTNWSVLANIHQWIVFFVWPLNLWRQIENLNVMFDMHSLT